MKTFSLAKTDSRYQCERALKIVCLAQVSYLGKKLHAVPFTAAAAAAAGEVEITADRRAAEPWAELAAVSQRSVGRRGSRSDGDVARSRQLAGTASPSSELADAGLRTA